ncbi:hypothetical protein F5Y08DRAFT_343526 [Xylaria arbuscula]|nr:hypothetical protein F5Y08DRAFT_343526 [Xylaria arbuscula]
MPPKKLPKPPVTIQDTFDALPFLLQAIRNRIFFFQQNHDEKKLTTIFERSGARSNHLSTVTIPKLTRETMAFRTWLLNYQIAHDLAFIVRDLDSEPKSRSLNIRLNHAIKHMTAVLPVRKMDLNTREMISSIANELRQYEIANAGMESEQQAETGNQMWRAEQQFHPSPALRKVERNLLVTRTLYFDINLRRVLSRGRELLHVVLQRFRYLKYRPENMVLPSKESDID